MEHPLERLLQDRDLVFLDQARHGISHTGVAWTHYLGVFKEWGEERGKKILQMHHLVKLYPPMQGSPHIVPTDHPKFYLPVVRDWAIGEEQVRAVLKDKGWENYLDVLITFGWQYNNSEVYLRQLTKNAVSQ